MPTENMFGRKVLIIATVIGFISGAFVSSFFRFHHAMIQNTVTKKVDSKEIDRIDKSVNEVYNLHSDNPLSEESRDKVDKIRKYIKDNPHLKSVAESEIKLGSVFVDMRIPVNQHKAAWKYYNREIDKLKVIEDHTGLQ